MQLISFRCSSKKNAKRLTVKPDVLLMGTLQTSGGTLVF